MKLGHRVKFALVVTPLFVSLALGYTIRIMLTNLQILYVGIPLLAGAFVFSSLSHKITKIVVGKHGFDKELNPIARRSLMRGTADQDHRALWIMLLVLTSFEYLLFPNIWLFLIAGGFGTMFLHWLNDYFVLTRRSRDGPLPTEKEGTN